MVVDIELCLTKIEGHLPYIFHEEGICIRLRKVEAELVFVM